MALQVRARYTSVRPLRSHCTRTLSVDRQALRRPTNAAWLRALDCGVPDDHADIGMVRLRRAERGERKRLHRKKLACHPAEQQRRGVSLRRPPWHHSAHCARQPNCSFSSSPFAPIGIHSSDRLQIPMPVIPGVVFSSTSHLTLLQEKEMVQDRCVFIFSHAMCKRASARQMVVVDPEQQRHGLGGELDGARVDEQRLQHVFLEDVGDLALAHVDARRALAQRVAVAQLGHDADRVQTRIFGERRGDHLERLGRQLVDRIAQDRLLDEQHVASGLFDLLAHVEQVLALLLEDLVHLAVVVHHDLVVHVRLGAAQLELAHGDLGLLHARGAAAARHDVLRQHEALDELRVVDGAADLLDDADVAQIHIVLRIRRARGADGRSAVGGRGGCWCGGRLVAGLGAGRDEAGDCVDGDGGKDGRVLRDDLGVETGAGGAQERLAVVELDGRRDVGEELDGLGGGLLEGLGDDGRVDALVEHFFGRAEQASGYNDDRGGAVAGLDVLRLRELDEHACSRVHDGHVFEDGGAVVGDDDLAVGRLDHLVHSLGAERGAHGIANGLGGGQVGPAHFVGLVCILEGVLRRAASCQWRSGRCCCGHIGWVSVKSAAVGSKRRYSL
ncbi:hypothetical protein L1887_42565 [Cichorium endivia]|nr:hypothetical protein L1887_42565 [Cichorium endivia]